MISKYFPSVLGCVKEKRRNLVWMHWYERQIPVKNLGSGGQGLKIRLVLHAQGQNLVRYPKRFESVFQDKIFTSETY